MEYDYYNLPDEVKVEAVPEELFEDAQAALREALTLGVAKVQEIKVAHVYDRHGQMTLDKFGGDRNASYGRDSDDVIIQLTVRVPHPLTTPFDLDRLTALEEKLTEHYLAAKTTKLEAEIAQAEADAEQAEATARQKREALDALRGKK